MPSLGLRLSENFRDYLGRAEDLCKLSPQEKPRKSPLCESHEEGYGRSVSGALRVKSFLALCSAGPGDVFVFNALFLPVWSTDECQHRHSLEQHGEEARGKGDSGLHFPQSRK